MAEFRYAAKNKITSQDVTGILDAQSLEEAQKILHSKNMIIISLKPEHTKLLSKKFMGNNVSLEDVVVFFRQLATLIDSGVNLVNAMEILKDQIDNSYFQRIVTEVYKDIQDGKSFCDAVAKHPKVFTEFYVNMIRAGEAGGVLNDTLERLATYLEKAQSLQRKVAASLVYPAVIIAMAFGITTLLLLKVVPTFKAIFATLGGTLPLPTQILIFISDMFGKFFPVFLGACVLSFFLLKRYLKTEKGRLRVDGILLKLPVFGSLFVKVAVARFSRTFAALIKSGVPILNAIQIVAKTSGNKVIEEAINKTGVSVRQGEPIYKTLELSGVFPLMVVRMIAVGEKTGELEKMLNKIATFYEEQVDSAVSGMASVIEPLVIAFLGVIIGGIVIALFLPIFKLSELLAQ